MSFFTSLKLRTIVVCLAFSGLLLANNTIASGNIRANTTTNVSSGYVVTKRRPNSRVWSSVVARTNLAGKVFYRTNSFTEMATGMHVLRNGAWAQASSAIQLAPDGSAAYATNSQHQVSFAANLHVNGAIDLVMPGGQHLQSTVLGLIYHDISSGTNVVIANLQDSVGQLLPTQNQIVYPNALTDPGVFSADVLYTHRLNGFEQDIILRQQPPSPEQFGLDPAKTHLQVWTEFFSPPEPTISTNFRTIGTGVGAREVLEDERLNFGSMRMGRGNAFASGGATNSPGIATEGMMLTPVAKNWLHFQGRTFLVEEVPFNAIAPQLSHLPALNSGTSNAPADVGTGEQSFFRPLPVKELHAKLNGKRMQMASADFKKRPGFLLDYDLINATLTNFTFQSDTTYYMSGQCNFYGTTTVEGGTVIKFADDGSFNAQEGDVNWLTSAYRPAFFTCTNDDSVGLALPGSSGIPNLSMATSCYAVEGGIVHDVHFAYCYNAYSGGAADVEVSDCQFINCSKPITANADTTNLGLHNLLITESDAINQGQSWSPDFAVTVYSTSPLNVYGEHVTTDLQSHDFLWTWYGGSLGSVSLTNSIILASNLLNCVDCDNPSDPNGANISTNFDYIASVNPGNLFQSLGAGNYYLADSSPGRNAGTSNIPPAILGDIGRKTTYPPVYFASNAFTGDIVLSPEVPRDTNASPDLGYHYPPIDFLSQNCSITNGTMLLTNGVVLGYSTSVSWDVLPSSGLISVGTPTQPNVIVHYRMVQEQASNIVSGTDPFTATEDCQPFTVGWYPSVTNPANINMRFTTISAANGEDSYTQTQDTLASFIMRDCEFYGAGSLLEMDNYATAPVLSFCNNLFHRLGVLVDSPGLLTCENNLFVGPGSVAFYHNGTNASSTAATNNVFDNAEVYLDGNYSYNAYVNGAILDMSAESNAIQTNATWVTGPLGFYYQSTNSPLVTNGSPTADLLGLYHYTTHTNQVPETNAIVDIGYHYVALDTNGLPVSTGGDGIPDYLKDSNGNGKYDAGDLGNWMTNWKTNSTCQDGISDYVKYLQGRNVNICTVYSDTNGILNLQVYTPLK